MDRVRTTLVIYQGEDFAFEVTWLDDAGEPVDVTKYTAHAQVRRNYHAEEVILDFSSDDDTIDLGEDGAVLLHATAAETSAVVMAGEGVWDLELTDEEGEVFRIAEGPVELSREVTRES